MGTSQTPSFDRFLDSTATEHGEAAEFLRKENARLQAQLRRMSHLKQENTLLRRNIVEVEHQLSTLCTLREHPITTHVIKPITGKRTGEATAFLLSSDTHIEEFVSRESVNGLNYYDLNVSRARYKEFFRRGYRLIEMFERDITIPTIVLLLGGDHITGSIHEDSAESNLLPPVDAIIRCSEDINSGIQFLLDQTKRRGTKIKVYCKTGNHGRMTPDRRISTEQGYSLERLLFEIVNQHFLTEQRVEVYIDPAYHTYLQVYDFTIRFHHGHNINYGGGIGGITVPVLKAINQWQTSRHADMDVFGHFHQYMVHKRFISNGSLIGWNTYANSIKAEFEPPQQTIFVIDKKRGRTWVEPIFVNTDTE